MTEPRREDVEQGIRSVLSCLKARTTDERAWNAWARRFLMRIDSTPSASEHATDLDDEAAGFRCAAAWAAHYWSKAQVAEGDDRARLMAACRRFLNHVGVEVTS